MLIIFSREITPYIPFQIQFLQILKLSHERVFFMGNLTRAVYTSKQHWNNRRALETRKGSIDQQWHTWGEDNISFTPSGTLQIIVSSTCTWNLLSFGDLYDLSILVVPRREASLSRLKYGKIIFTYPRNIFDPQLNCCQLFRIYFLPSVNFELFPPFFTIFLGFTYFHRMRITSANVVRNGGTFEEMWAILEMTPNITSICDTFV